MKTLLTLMLILMLPAMALSQTTVTGTIVDPNGNPYANGTSSAIQVVVSGQNPGTPITVSTTNAGSFTMTLPSPASYTFTICAMPTQLGPTANPTPKQVCFSNSVPIAISGGSENVSTQLNAVAAILGPVLNALSATNLNGPGAVTGNYTHSGTETFSGGSPWFDVTGPPFNAKCDGSTDDTVAIQAALTAASNAGGGNVVIPPKSTPCIVAASGTSVLNMSSFQQVTLSGLSGGAYGINLVGSTPVNPNQKGYLQFTGNPSTSLINAQGTFGVTFQNLLIQYTNASFTGLIVDTSHNATANDTQKFSFVGNAVTGTSSAQGAACGVCMDKTINSTVRDNNFQYMKVGVRGLASIGSYQNGVRVEDNMFGSGATGMGTTAIQNMGQGSIISGNVIEIGNAATTQTAIDGSGASSSCLGCSITGNWIGDAPTTWTGTLINQVGDGLNVSGNALLTSSTASGTLMNFQSAAVGISITGNELGNAATGFVFTGSNQSQVTIAGNSGQTLTAFQSGAPASGIVENTNTNVKTDYGESATSFPVAVGPLPALTGTGACLTADITTQVGGSWAGSAVCTNTTGASTLVITPGSTALHGWSCWANDLTTAANILRQSATATGSCTIAGTVNANDVITFGAIAY
jgi:hypothetical protein